MKALIIYDTVYGNTEKIAQSVARGFGSSWSVSLVRVGDVKPAHLAGLALLLVGSPTHAFRPLPSIKTYLAGLPAKALQGVKVAAFDTRMSPEITSSAVFELAAKLFGYAAKPIGDALVRKGGKLVIAPEGFIVKASEGPLLEGELARATTWGRQVATR